MVFSMPASEKKLDRNWLFSLLAATVLTACSDPSANERFELTRIDADWSNGRVDVICEQKLAFSSEAREALIHGVPLTIDLELTLRDTASQIRVADQTNSYEIRYLPLSDHYQLTHAASNSVKTFPRLRHVLADLSKLQISIETGVLPSGQYELLARARLDQESMPPPMRLPVLLSARWQHDSSWSSWPLEINSGS
jgi:hypothetical protein